MAKPTSIDLWWAWERRLPLSLSRLGRSTKLWLLGGSPKNEGFLAGIDSFGERTGSGLRQSASAVSGELDAETVGPFSPCGKDAPPILRYLTLVNKVAPPV